MKVKITITAQSGSRVQHETDVGHEGDLVGAIANALDDFHIQSRESVFNCTINVDHACLATKAPRVDRYRMAAGY